uniref:PXA domain-containing protein n=1 Tax=Meloidogyne javanica TaxID=6303 RepID=A0A915MI29_MELJA
MFSSLVAFSSGFLICRVLLQNPQYCIWLQHVFANIIYDDKELVEEDNEHLLKNLNDSKESDEPTVRPWDRLKLDENFNSELDEFFKTLVVNYVNSWYNENLSEDESFTSEIRQLIRHSSAKILTTFMEADVLQIFTDEIIPVIIAHVERVVRILNEFSSERFSSFELQ